MLNLSILEETLSLYKVNMNAVYLLSKAIYISKLVDLDLIYNTKEFQITL